MTQHTPTPWHRNIPPASHYPTVFSGRNKHVLCLKTTGMTPDEVEANMQFVLSACNSHDDLVVALRAAFPIVKAMCNALGESCTETDADALVKIEDALTLIEQKWTGKRS